MFITFLFFFSFSFWLVLVRAIL